MASHDPLGLALLLAAIAHAALILGVGFDFEKNRPASPTRMLDVTVVRAPRQAEPPETPDFLAASSQDGGAETAGQPRLTSPPSPPALEPQDKPTREIQRSGVPQQHNKPRPRVVTSKESSKKLETPKEASPVRALQKPDVAQLLASTQKEISRLTEELDRQTFNAAQRPRRKAINASTQEYKYANYLETWRKKVERIGNLNYPDEAKRKKLYGNLLLHVAVRADGSVQDIRVVKSSGHKILDDAAIRIVKLAAPYSPFPPEISKEVDVLDITRTWQFLSGNRLFTNR